MTSFEEYCPLCEGGLLASGGLLAGGGYACASADSVPTATRARTRRVVRIIVCIACLLPHELTVEFRRATGSGLDLVQKFPQVHLSIRRGPTVRIVLQVA
jgi:hypothetical protein